MLLAFLFSALRPFGALSGANAFPLPRVGRGGCGGGDAVGVVVVRSFVCPAWDADVGGG